VENSSIWKTVWDSYIENHKSEIMENARKEAEQLGIIKRTEGTGKQGPDGTYEGAHYELTNI